MVVMRNKRISNREKLRDGFLGFRNEQSIGVLEESEGSKWALSKGGLLRQFEIWKPKGQPG